MAARDYTITRITVSMTGHELDRARIAGLVGPFSNPQEGIERLIRERAVGYLTTPATDRHARSYFGETSVLRVMGDQEDLYVYDLYLRRRFPEPSGKLGYDQFDVLSLERRWGSRDTGELTGTLSSVSYELGREPRYFGKEGARTD